MEWFEELGFNENPFGLEPGFSARYSAGLESQVEELEYLIKSGSFVFVEGASGSGKSVLLKLLADKLGNGAIYVNAVNGFDAKSALRSKTSLIGHLLGKSPKNLVILVDEAGCLSKQAMEQLKYNFDNNCFGSVVLSGKSLKSAGLSASIIDRIGSRVVSIPALTEDAAVLMVARRLGNSGGLLGDDAVRRIYRRSGGNAKRFLQLCEEEARASAMKKPALVEGGN